MTKPKPGTVLRNKRLALWIRTYALQFERDFAKETRLLLLAESIEKGKRIREGQETASILYRKLRGAVNDAEEFLKERDFSYRHSQIVERRTRPNRLRGLPHAS